MTISLVYRQLSATTRLAGGEAPPPGGTEPGGYGVGAAPSSKGGSLRARPLPGPQTGGRERIQAGAGSGAKAESRTAGEAAASCENVSDDRSARAQPETKREEFRARRLTAVSSLCDIVPATPVSAPAPPLHSRTALASFRQSRGGRPSFQAAVEPILLREGPISGVRGG